MVEVENEQEQMQEKEREDEQREICAGEGGGAEREGEVGGMCRRRRGRMSKRRCWT